MAAPEPIVVVAPTAPNVTIDISPTDEEVFKMLEHLQSNVNTLTTMTTVLCVILLLFFLLQALAVVIQLVRRCGKKNIEKAAEKSKKSSKDGKKSSKSSKKSKSKKGKSKKSKKSKSKTSSSKSAKKSVEKKLPKLPSLKAAASEKKSEIVGGKKSGESAQKQPPSLTSTSVIKLQPQDPLLSLSNLKLSGEKAIPPTKNAVGQVEKEIKIMNNLEAEKLKALPLPPIIAAAIDSNQKIPEATTPPIPTPKTSDADKNVGTPSNLKLEKQSPEATTPPLPPPKTTDSSTDAASASLKFAKQYPDATTPPQRTPQKLIEAEAEKPKPSSDGSDSSARKVADVSSPPPLMAAPKPNTDSLMLPVSTPPLAPVSPQPPSTSATNIPPKL